MVTLCIPQGKVFSGRWFAASPGSQGTKRRAIDMTDYANYIKTNWMGNVVDLPRIRPWLTYAQWKDVYGIYDWGSHVFCKCLWSTGDLIYIRVFGNPILGDLFFLLVSFSSTHTVVPVLNSAVAASDLLEKRGGKYSSRPIRTMIVELFVILVVPCSMELESPSLI
jgi:hypothetical protein